MWMSLLLRPNFSKEKNKIPVHPVKNPVKILRDNYKDFVNCIWKISYYRNHESPIVEVAFLSDSSYFVFTSYEI